MTLPRLGSQENNHGSTCSSPFVSKFEARPWPTPARRGRPVFRTARTSNRTHRPGPARRCVSALVTRTAPVPRPNAAERPRRPRRGQPRRGRSPGSPAPQEARRQHRASLKEAIDRFHADTSLKSDASRRWLGAAQVAPPLHGRMRRDRIRQLHSVLHRDIKPGNITVGKHGETLVVQLGARQNARADRAGVVVRRADQHDRRIGGVRPAARSARLL